MVSLLLAKDFFLSAVDTYPYAQEAATLTPFLIGAYLTLRRPAKSNVASPSDPVDKRLLVRLIGVLPAFACVVLLCLFLRGISSITWTGDTALGLGLGGRTLSTSLLSSVEPVAPLPGQDTAAGAIATEQGFLTLFAVVGLILATAVAVVRRAWSPARQHEAIMAFVGMAGTDVLLAFSLRRPAFLTFDTIWGTFVLAFSLVLAGMAARPAFGSNAGQKPTETGRRSYRRRFRRLAIVLAIIAPSIALVDAGVHVYVARTLPNARQTIGVPITSISQSMQDATVSMEDGNFYRHHGIDWQALHRALRFDLRLGEVKQGGSTITQQLAKNVYLHDNDRTLWRKTEDIVLAAEIEHELTKKQILELYLNTIDYGMGQHGIKSAAAYYFHKPPAELTAAESACLVGIVPDPMQQNLDLGRVQEGEQTALGRMAFWFPNRYSQADIDEANAIPLDRVIYPFKDAWDRGATHEIPAIWHGVSFYFFADPDTPEPVEQSAQCFKVRLAGFLDDAHRHLGLVGIDHLGLYNDRTTRFSTVDLSAHAFGQAMDMSGFRFADGTRIAVVDHTKPAVMKRVAPVEAMLNRHFDAVVDWRDNALHQTHFHVEVKGPRPTAWRSPTAPAL